MISNKKKEISIITCTYNSEKYIKECINSVKSQIDCNFEHLFIDAYSTDKTIEIINKYKKEYPNNVRICFQTAQGISSAMNYGALSVKSEIIAFLHSDDFYKHKAVLKNIIKVFNAKKVEWCFGNCISFQEKNNRYVYLKTPKYSYNKLLRRNIISHPSTFVSKRVFDEVGGFNQNLKYAMDYDLWVRIGKNYTPHQIDDFISVFRNHPNSLSSSNFIQAIREEYAIRKTFDRKFNEIIEDFIRMLFFEYKALLE